MAYMETDLPTVVQGNGGNNSGFGGDGWWGIILIALLFGWGRGGYGFGGSGGGSEMLGYELGKVASTNDVASGFSTSAIMSNQREMQLAQAQGFANVQQTLCQGFNGINTTLMQGFHGVDNSICTLGYNMAQGFNGVSRQISDCCCELRTQSERNTQRIIDFMQTEKINALTAENVALKGRISNDAQTAAIVGALGPKQPIPAYPVFPTTSFAYPTGVSFGVGGNNCGCNGY